MKVIELFFAGRIPSKKNSRNIFVSKTGKRMNIPSNDYLKWHKKTSLEILNQMKEVLFDVKEVKIDFYMPDNRRCDLTNKAESLLDLLVDVEILADDSWQCVPEIKLTCKGVDKKNPGARVWIVYEE